MQSRTSSEAALQGEMDAHLGYEANEHGEKKMANRRNGYSRKSVKTTYGKLDVSVPRGSFEPKAIPKRAKDSSGMEEDKALSMYARDMSRRGIADTTEDIYGFHISHETISTIMSAKRLQRIHRPVEEGVRRTQPESRRI